ncbi:MAG: alpha/beta hydrolase [Acidimicrobiales bacterium]
MTYVPVPFDPEVEQVLADMMADRQAPPLSAETIALSRGSMNAMWPSVAEVVGDLPVHFEDRRIPGPPGAPELEITILRPKESKAGAPAIYNMHGGGLIMGTRHMDTARLVPMVVEFGFVAVNVDYRLAPETPGSGPADDCYAGLLWMVGHSDELGFDPDRLLVMGGSAGGNLAAAMSLLARDRGSPTIRGQVLLVPMLDDRNTTVSSYQFDDIGTWNRHSNLVAWRAVLGDEVGGEAVSSYVAPARAKDLSNLPPAYIELGSAELFRDESIEYAQRIWAAGGQAELHIWSGGCHGFDIFCPDARLTKAALQARRSWVERIIR